MWNRIKRILKNALLLPILIAFQDKGHYEEAPPPEHLTTESQETAIGGLEDLAYGDLPTLPTFDLEDVPAYGQLEDLAAQDLPTLPTLDLESIEAYGLGMEEIKKVLGDAYDPFKSPFYQGLREASMREEEAGVSNLRRRSQMGGMLKSDPSRRTESEYRGGMGTGRTMMLGEMYETERGRKQEMIPNLLSYAGLGADVGKFNTQVGIQQALLPYTAQAPLLQSLAGIGADVGMFNTQIGIEQAMLPYTAQAPIMEGLAEGYGTWFSPEMLYYPGFLETVLPAVGGILSIL